MEISSSSTPNDWARNASRVSSTSEVTSTASKDNHEAWLEDFAGQLKTRVEAAEAKSPS